MKHIYMVWAWRARAGGKEQVSRPVENDGYWTFSDLEKAQQAALDNFTEGYEEALLVIEFMPWAQPKLHFAVGMI